uniref:Uncharacterized protein n=1 Tax=Schistocephalus solidus TaxID=70667 RepID=A0A0V0JAQ6_SCHSO
MHMAAAYEHNQQMTIYFLSTFDILTILTISANKVYYLPLENTYLIYFNVILNTNIYKVRSHQKFILTNLLLNFISWYTISSPQFFTTSIKGFYGWPRAAPNNIGYISLYFEIVNICHKYYVVGCTSHVAYVQSVKRRHRIYCRKELCPCSIILFRALQPSSVS